MNVYEFKTKAEAAGYIVHIERGPKAYIGLDNGRQVARYEFVTDHTRPLEASGRLTIQSTIGLFFRVTVPLASLDDALVMLGVQEFVQSQRWDDMYQWAASKPRRDES